MILLIVSGFILIVMMLVICIVNGAAWSKANINDSFIKVWLLTYSLIQVVAIIAGIAQYLKIKYKTRSAEKVE